jgi:hypothetical protein
MDARQREQLIADLYVGLVFDRVPGFTRGATRKGETAKRAIALADDLIEELDSESHAGRVVNRHSDRVSDDLSERA